MNVFKQPLVGFDTETTGVDVFTDRIVTASLVWNHPDHAEDKIQTWLINPGVEIPEGAAKIHGITTEQASKYGMPPQQALTEILTALQQAQATGIPVVAYNAAYDFTLLREELVRHECEPIAGDFGPVIDPMVLDKFLDPYRKGSRKLVDVAAHYGLKLDNDGAHDATWDARAAIGIARAMGASTGADNVTDPRWLHDAQIGYQMDQQVSLNQHWKRTNKADRIRPPGWPFQPAQEKQA